VFVSTHTVVFEANRLYEQRMHRDNFFPPAPPLLEGQVYRPFTNFPQLAVEMMSSKIEHAYKLKKSLSD
jgi:hypothetical protein